MSDNFTLFDLPEKLDKDSGMSEKVKVNSVVGKAILEASKSIDWPDNYHIVDDSDQMQYIAEFLKTTGDLIFDVETSGDSPWLDKLYCISIYTSGQAWIIPFDHKFITKLIKLEDFQKILGPCFNDPCIRLTNHNLKFDCHFLEEQAGIKVGRLYCDTMLASKVLDCNKFSPHGLKELCDLYGFGDGGGNYTKRFGKTAWSVIEPKLACYYACGDVEKVYKLRAKQIELLNAKPKLKRLFWQMEMEVENITYNAERIGLRVDNDYLQNELRPYTYEEYGKAVLALRPYLDPYLTNGDTCVDILESPKKLGNVFFEKLGVPLIPGITLKTKTNPVTQEETQHRSLDKDAIAALKKEYECIKHLGTYRGVATLKKLFIDKLPRFVVNERIHATINDIGTDTGRMSMRAPNLQQIPSRMGPRVRNAFIADPGEILISMDFSQQELRIMTHYCRDPKLIAIFEQGKDLYSETAYELWGIGTVGPLNTDEQKKKSWHRATAKMLILGLLFGMGFVKFGKNSGLTRNQAKELYEKFHATYPGIKKYQERTASYARKTGSIVTMSGRERPLKDINSPNNIKSSKDERAAGNTPIQGTAADMTKITAIKVQRLITANNWPIRIALFIHDEIVYSANEAWAKANPQHISAIREIHETALPLLDKKAGVLIPMKSSVQYESRWGTEVRLDEVDIDSDVLDSLEEEAA